MDYGYNGSGAVKRIQEIMMDEGYYDIGYHYIVGPDGAIYEGRDIGARGSHVSGDVGNTGKIGILWLGAFNETGPTEAQVASTASLIVSLDKTYEINSIGTHREYEVAVGSYTDCPGEFAIPFVNILKQLIP